MKRVRIEIAKSKEYLIKMLDILAKRENKSRSAVVSTLLSKALALEGILRQNTESESIFQEQMKPLFSKDDILIKVFRKSKSKRSKSPSVNQQKFEF